MSKPLTFDKILEDLQGVIHDLSDLSAQAGVERFNGIVIEDLLVQYRDMGPSMWKITIEPQPPSRNRPVEEADEVAQSPTV
jgi:hypothetical protein